MKIFKEKIDEATRRVQGLKTEKKVMSVKTSNNYMLQNKIKISLLLDIISFNIHSYDIYLFYTYILNDPLSSVFNIRFPKDKYGNQIISFLLQLNRNFYSISLIDKSSSITFPNVLYIKNPDLQLLLYLDRFLSRIRYHVQKVEFTFDFQGKDNERILHKLFNLYYFKSSSRSRQLKRKYKTCQYSNNIWKCDRGMKIYLKDRSNGETVVRLEVTDKRQSLVKMGVEKIKDLINLDIEKVVSQFTFRIIDFNRYLDLHLKQLASGKETPCYKYMKQTMASPANLLKKSMEIMMEVKTENYAAGALIAKQSLTYELFLKHPFEDHFKSKLMGKSFLTHDYILVDADILFS